MNTKTLIQSEEPIDMNMSSWSTPGDNFVTISAPVLEAMLGHRKEVSFAEKKAELRSRISDCKNMQQVIRIFQAEIVADILFGEHVDPRTEQYGDFPLAVREAPRTKS